MGGVDTDRGVRRTRSAGDEGDAGFAGHLAPGIGHVGNATFLAADDEVDLVLNVVERIERGEIAFTRHAEDGIDAVQTQAIDKDLSAGAEVRRRISHDLYLDEFVQKNRVFLALGFVLVFLVHVGNR